MGKFDIGSNEADDIGRRSVRDSRVRGAQRAHRIQRPGHDGHQQTGGWFGWWVIDDETTLARSFFSLL